MRDKMMQYLFPPKIQTPEHALIGDCTMQKMPKAVKPTIATKSAQIGRELLTPIAAFLIKSGISQAQVLSEFRLAIRRASASKLKVIHMGIGEEASSIVNRWLRDPLFINDVGRPAELPLKGTRSITSLIRASQTKVSATAAVNMLVEFGLVKRVVSGKYRLVSRLVDFGHSEYLPFEPNFRFLVDATKVSTSRLRNSRKTPGLFWQCADNAKIDARQAQKFLRFAQRRSLSFMHEMNDWLDEHECKRSNSIRKTVQLKRLGIGLFGICR